MSGWEPREEVEKYLQRLSGNSENSSEVPLEADRRHIIKTVGNMRLMQPQVGDYRQRDVVRIARQIAIHAPWPTIEHFRDNDEATSAGVKTAADVEELVENHGVLGIALDYRAGAEAIVRWINRKYTNEHTNQDYRSALRSFGRYRYKRKTPPESLSWIPTTTSSNHDVAPSARDLLLWEEDVLPMIEVARNSRDKALIAVQFEAGFRSGELRDLRVSDVFDSTYSMGIHGAGKQGDNKTHLIDSASYLQQWLSDHPGGGDDYLWSKLTEPERPSYNTWLNYFKDAAERAGVSKDVTPTNFRKSNTRWLIQEGYDQPSIENRQGRITGSKHTRRYYANFQPENAEKRYAKLRGKDVETEESKKEGPIECPRCGQETPSEGDRCMKCGMALSKDVAREAEQKQRESLETLQQLQELEDIDIDSAVDVLDELVSSRVQAAIRNQHS